MRRSARALQVEYEAIVNSGLLLQIDAPDLALERHITYKDRPVSAFVDFRRRGSCDHQPRARAMCRATACACTCAGAIRNRRTIVTCRSKTILPALLAANVGGLVLPFANPRHAHEFRCFAKHPLKDDQILVAGVIDSLTNFVEHPEVVADRISASPQSSAIRRGCSPGTDCGFDTSAGWGRVAEDVVWAKLTSHARRRSARFASGCFSCSAEVLRRAA